MMTSQPTAPEAQAVSSARRLARKAVRRAVGFAALVVVAAIGVAMPCRAGGAKQGPLTREQVADAVHVCSTCHGRAGRRTSPNFPRLTGQRAEYLGAELRAFRDKMPLDRPHARISMASMAAHLDDAMIARLAAYYSAQTPMSGAARHPAVAAAGGNIYAHGIPGRVLPCMACHGVNRRRSGTPPGSDNNTLIYREEIRSGWGPGRLRLGPQHTANFFNRIDMLTSIRRGSRLGATSQMFTTKRARDKLAMVYPKPGNES